jgi:hypothetical protein
VSKRVSYYGWAEGGGDGGWYCRCDPANGWTVGLIRREHQVSHAILMERYAVYFALLSATALSLFVLTDYKRSILAVSFKHAAPLALEQYTPGHKVILLWTTFFGSPMFPVGKSAFEGCPEPRCYFSYNRARSGEASLVVMHLRDLVGGVSGLPPQHPVAQS